MSLSEVERARIFMLDLAKSFFLGEPSEEKCQAWEKALAALDGKTGFAPLDQAVRDLREYLAQTPLSALSEEYYRLFVDPFNEKPVLLTASYYIDGKNYGPTLAKLRGFLKEIGLVKDENFKEPEDSLVCLLDFLISLIYIERKELSRAQEELLTNFLKPCVEGLSQALEEREEAGFYRRCAAFLKAYILLEERFFLEGEV